MRDEERAQAFAQYREGVPPNLPELLMDLEEEPELRELVVAQLRRLNATDP